MEKGSYTSVVDTPEIIHAQQVRNLSSQVGINSIYENNKASYDIVIMWKSH